jgi:hypothetical protein
VKAEAMSGKSSNSSTASAGSGWNRHGTSTDSSSVGNQGQQRQQQQKTTRGSSGSSSSSSPVGASLKLAVISKVAVGCVDIGQDPHQVHVHLCIVVRIKALRPHLRATTALATQPLVQTAGCCWRCGRRHRSVGWYGAAGRRGNSMLPCFHCLRTYILSLTCGAAGAVWLSGGS